MKPLLTCISSLLALMLVSCGSSPAASTSSVESSSSVFSTESSESSPSQTTSADSSPSQTSSPDSSPEVDPPQEVITERVIYRLKDDGTYEASKYHDPTGIIEHQDTVAIAAELYGRPVTSIPDYGFVSDGYVHSFILPDTITSIGDYAFYDCASLESINIPKGLVSLGDFAFAKAWSPRSLTLPKSLTHIGVGAFWVSHGTRLTLEEGNTAFSLQGNALYNADETELIAFVETPDEYEAMKYYPFSVPSTVRSIWGYSFSTSYLSELFIPGSVKSIGDCAFLNWGLHATIHLSEGLERIGDEAFPRMDGHVINLPSTVSYVGRSAFYPTQNGGPQLTVDADHPYFRIESGCLIEKATQTIIAIVEILSEYRFDDGILAIGDFAFERLIGSWTSSIVFPNTLVSVGRQAVKRMCFDASGLPDSLREIGYFAFINCKVTGGRVLSIGKNVRRVDLHAFHGIYDIDGVSVSNENPYFSDDDGNLYNKEKTVLLEIATRESIEASICETTTEIAEEAAYCTKINGMLRIPESVKTIGARAFQQTRISSLYLPCGISRIGDGAFEGAYNLKDVYYDGSAAEWAEVGLGENVFDAGVEIHFSGNALDVED